MGKSYEIYCNDSMEYPIEHLYKAIYILQDLPECIKEVERLTKLINKYWAKVEINKKKKLKIYENYILQPSGICYPEDFSYNRIVVGGYDLPYEEEKQRKTPKEPAYYSVLKDFCPFWYIQVKEYKKTKPTFGQYEGCLPNVIEYFNKVEAFSLLTDEEANILNIKDPEIYEYKTMVQRFFRLFRYIENGYNYYYNSKTVIIECYILSNEEIEYLIEVLENLRGHNMYNTKQELEKGIKKLVSTFLENRNLSSGDISFVKSFTEEDQINFFEKVYSKLLTINDETVIKLLKKYNILPEDHVPLEATEEETIEEAVEVLEVVEEADETQKQFIEVDFSVS
jgi:hypothetical protein